MANLAVMLGDRYFGWRGAVAGLAGLFAIPALAGLALAIGYQSLTHLPEVQGAMRGLALVVSALILTTAIKLVPALSRHPGGRLFCALSGLSTVLCVVWLKWPLLWVLLLVGTASCLWTYRRLAAPAAKAGPHA